MDIVVKTAQGEHIDVELQYLELSKLDLSKPVSDMTEIERWGAYLRSAGEPAHQRLVEQLRKENGGIEMAESVRIKVSEDERLRVKAMLDEKYQLDRLTEIHRAERKGLEEGLKATAVKMRERGIDPETIREITGLDPAQLGELSDKKED